MPLDGLAEAVGDDLAALLLEERRLGRLIAIREMLALLSGLLDEAPDREPPAVAARRAGGLHRINLVRGKTRQIHGHVLTTNPVRRRPGFKLLRAWPATTLRAVT